MKQHYKSRLIINRFSKKIWFYDVENESLTLKQAQKILYEIDIYDEIIEEKMAKLESMYSNIIDHCVLDKEVIEITREQLHLIKKFLLVDSLRQMFGDGIFNKFFTSFERNAKRYVDLYSRLYPNDSNRINKLKSKKHLSELELSENEKFTLSLKVILDNDIFELEDCPDCPIEIIAWSKAITDSYLKFWDSNEEEEFILNDTNMMSEYEMCHAVFSGIELERKSYLYSKLKDNTYNFYLDFLLLQEVMYENFNIFNISNTRAIVCINPFFKLYSDRILENYAVKIEKPDVWCSSIFHLEAFEIPTNKYKIDFRFHTSEDIFIYHPYKLTKSETININMTLLNQSKSFFGFVNKNKVVNTITYANVANAFYEVSNRKAGTNSLDLFTHSLLSNKYYPILKNINDEGCKSDINPFELFEKHTNYSQMGLDFNTYVYNSFLEKIASKSISFEIFDFLKEAGIRDLTKYFEEKLSFANGYKNIFMKSIYDSQHKEDVIEEFILKIKRGVI